MKRLFSVFLCMVGISSFSGVVFAQVDLITRSQIIQQQIKQENERHDAKIAALQEELKKIQDADAVKKRQDAVAQYLLPQQKNPKALLQITPPSPWATEYAIKIGDLSPASQKQLMDIIKKEVKKQNDGPSRTKLSFDDGDIVISSCVDRVTGRVSPTCTGHLMGFELTNSLGASYYKYMATPIFKGDKVIDYKINQIDPNLIKLD